MVKCRKCSIRDTEYGLCGVCVQNSGYLEKYPVLSVILDDDSILRVASVRSGVKSCVNRVTAKCQVCLQSSEVDLISLLKNLRKNVRVGSFLPYRCHPCSKPSKTGVDFKSLNSVVDMDMTVAKYGKLPDSVKKGRLVVRCEDCSKPSDVKLSSLLHQARRHAAFGRACLYKCFSCGVKRPDAMEASADARVKQLSSGFRSNLEVAMANRLDALNIRYEEQFKLGIYVWDFFLPDHATVLDVDGEYWHSLPKNSAKDRSKLTYTERYFAGYYPLHIEEKYFLNPAAVDKFLLSKLNDVKVPAPVSFEFCDVAIRRIKCCASAEFVPFLNSFHYSGNGRLGKVAYGAYLGDTLVAACKFSPVVRKEVASSIGLKCNQALELDRFCIHPRYQKKNLASWMISRCVRLVFAECPDVLSLVSFADETFGHSGTIYKAANWRMIGKTRPSYHYMSQAGVAINKKRVFDMASKLSMKEKDYVDKHGFSKFVEQPKTKFIVQRNM